MNHPAAAVERFLTAEQLRELIPFSRMHIHRLMRRGDFPRPLKLGEQRVAWKESEIRAWLESRPRAEYPSFTTGRNAGKAGGAP
jgi:prophage regulatory protein